MGHGEWGKELNADGWHPQGDEKEGLYRADSTHNLIPLVQHTMNKCSLDTMWTKLSNVWQMKNSICPFLRLTGNIIVTFKEFRSISILCYLIVAKPRPIYKRVFWNRWKPSSVAMPLHSLCLLPISIHIILFLSPCLYCDIALLLIYLFSYYLICQRQEGCFPGYKNNLQCN